ncbi:GNAT family N-acetyltransferase [Streptomyces sp. JJ36]|uniref:GNAT family N-acetyltransferase n=1 Tax=Streptomyces sp. JJ36 TaxID=2736645 RepID=UPI001F2A4160|nr:GNAT family N-acetyltransferase [Streptomyces sp. JJ36]MCF6521787.1 GNAT family N-acetyltransferase [Streptomyces sp. JJ36]
MTIRTAVVPLPEVFPLRWEVLRPGLPRESAEFPGDAQPGVFHVAAYDGDAEPGEGAGAGVGVLGCGSFYPEPAPDGAGPAYRIRGMASAARARGRGYGAAVLRAGEEEAAARGAVLMWCNGRTEARGFYERHGYEAVGEEFVIEGVGPHHVFLRKLG